MTTYYLTVMQHTGREVAPIVATVLRVDVDKPISWVKQHADEIAGYAQIDNYVPRRGLPCALWVGASDPMKEIAA